MDLGTVKAAPKADLVACAVAAAANAQDLLGDAEMLPLAGRRARACSLAVLAVEEVGKAASLMALALVPQKQKGQAPIRRMLAWHELKLVGGLLIAMIPPGAAAAPKIAGMPAGELAQIMDNTKVLVQDEDRLKLHGLYVDMDGRGTSPSHPRSPKLTFPISSPGPGRPCRPRRPYSIPARRPGWPARRLKRSSSLKRSPAPWRRQGAPALPRPPPTSWSRL